MSAQELYDEMKAALKFFQLSFHQMDQMRVLITNEEITFSYDRSSITIRSGA